MRFFHPNDDLRLTEMVLGGALRRDSLQSAVGEQAVALLDALVEHEKCFPTAPWLAWGIRHGFARLNHSHATQSFLQSLPLSGSERLQLAASWSLPFTRNRFGQLAVAQVPGWPTPVNVRHLVGIHPIPCILTLGELSELRAHYLLPHEFS